MKSQFSKFGQADEGSEQDENEEEYDSQSANSKPASSRRSKRAPEQVESPDVKAETTVAINSDQAKSCPILPQDEPAENENAAEEQAEAPAEESKAPAALGEFEEAKGGKKLTEIEKMRQMMERRQQMLEKAAATKASNFTAAQAQRKADQVHAHEHQKSPTKHEKAGARATGDKKKKEKKAKKHHKKGKKDKETKDEPEEGTGLQRQFSFGDDNKKPETKNQKKVFKFSDATSDISDKKQPAKPKKETLKPKLKKASVTPPEQKKKSAFAAAAEYDDEEEEEEDDDPMSQSSGSVTAKLQASNMEATVPIQVRESVAKVEVDSKEKLMQRHGTESQLLGLKGSQIETEPQHQMRLDTNAATHGSSNYYFPRGSELLGKSRDPDLEHWRSQGILEYQSEPLGESQRAPRHKPSVPSYPVARARSWPLFRFEGQSQEPPRENAQELSVYEDSDRVVVNGQGRSRRQVQLLLELLELTEKSKRQMVILTAVLSQYTKDSFGMAPEDLLRRSPSKASETTSNAPLNPTSSRAPKNMTEIIQSNQKRDSQITHSSGLSSNLMVHRASIMPNDMIFGTQAIIQSKLDPRQGKHSGSKFGNQKSKHHVGDKDTRSVHSKKKMRPTQKSSVINLESQTSSRGSIRRKKKVLMGEKSGDFQGNQEKQDLTIEPSKKKPKKRRNSHSFKTKNSHQRSRYEGNINSNDEDIGEEENKEVSPQNKKKNNRKMVRFKSVLIPAEEAGKQQKQFEDHLTKLANFSAAYPKNKMKAAAQEGNCHSSREHQVAFELVLEKKDPSTPSSDDVRTIDFDERAILMQSSLPKSMVDISSSQHALIDKNSTFSDKCLNTRNRRQAPYFQKDTPSQREEGLKISMQQSFDTVGEKCKANQPLYQRTSSQNLSHLSGLAHIPKKACYTSCFSFNGNGQSMTSKSQSGGFVPPAIFAGLAGEISTPQNQQKRKRSNSGNNWNLGSSDLKTPINLEDDDRQHSDDNPDKAQIGDEGWINSFPAVFQHGLSAKINQKIIEESHPLTDMTPTNTNMSHYSDNFHHMQNSRMEDDPHYGVQLNAFGEPMNPVTEDRYQKEKIRAQSILHVDQETLLAKPPTRQESMRVRRLSGYQKSEDSNVESTMSLQIQQRNITSIQSTHPVKLIEASNRIHSAKMAALRAKGESGDLPEKWASNLTEDASSEAVNTRSNNNSNQSKESKNLYSQLRTSNLQDQLQKSRATNMQIPQPAISSQSLREMTEEEKNMTLPRSPPTSDRMMGSEDVEDPQPKYVTQTTFGKHSRVRAGQNRFQDDNNDYSDYNSESASKNSRPDASSAKYLDIGSGRSDNKKSLSSQSGDHEEPSGMQIEEKKQDPATKNMKSQFKYYNHSIQSSESGSESNSTSRPALNTSSLRSQEESDESSDYYDSEEESDYESSDYCSSDASSSENSQKQAYIKMLEQKFASEIQKQKKTAKPEGEGVAEMSTEEVLARNNERNRMLQRNIAQECLDDPTLPHYPSMIEDTPEHKEAFLKSFGVVIGKKLKKKLSVLPNLEELQLKYKKSEANAHKKTLIISGDDCILKTDMYKDQLPRIDGKFKFMKFDILICLRPFLKEFLYGAQKHFEVILWTSSQAKYSDGLVKSLEESLDFKFDHVLAQDQQTPSEEKEFTVKNIEVLTGLGNRSEKDIIMVDTTLEAFTNRLTNGIFVPTQKLLEDDKDNMLKILLKYLASFVLEEGSGESFDVRNKIKVDFGLLEKFNGFKQSQAFLKIKRTLEEVMGEGEEEEEEETK